MRLVMVFLVIGMVVVAGGASILLLLFMLGLVG